MTVKLISDNKEIPVNMVEFSDGAITFKVDELPEDPSYISIHVCPTTPVYRIREEMELLADAILSNDDVNFFNTKWYLDLPYLPYGRADRRFEKGNPIPLSNFLSWLRDEWITMDGIYICDIHNPEYVLEDFVGLNIVEKYQLECFKNSITQDFNTDYDFVLAPDKGSVEKAKTIACHLEVDVYNCGKERDMSTGRIIRSTLPEGVDFTDKTVLIPDDLCDGGFTFIKLAEQIKAAGAKQVDLYVTHMIGSKGLDTFKGLIDNIYCYHIVGKYLNKEEVWRYNDNV